MSACVVKFFYTFLVYRLIRADYVNRKKRPDAVQHVVETESVQNSRQDAAVAHYQHENDYNVDNSAYQQVDLSSGVSGDKHVYKQLNKTARR